MARVLNLHLNAPHTQQSQICGGKRYDLATLGRRLANATYAESHGTDVVEIFICDGGDERTYLEIEVNTNNAVLHYEIHDEGSNKTSFERIEHKIISAAKKEKGRTTYEIAIPINKFLNTIESDVNWHFNLYKIDRGNYGFDEYSAFSPTREINYQHPECFGSIGFVSLFC